LLATVLTVVAAFTHPAVQIAIPLLVAGEVAIADEHTRLVYFGVIIAFAFAGAVLRLTHRLSSFVVAAAAIVILRWIPFGDVLPGRELVLIGVALAIVAVLRGTPLAVAVAVLAVLFTPAIPLRTLVFPIAILIGAALLRAFRVRTVQGHALAAVLIALPLLFFAWSGAFARSLPVLLRGVPSEEARFPVRMALRAGESVELDVPDGARWIVLSGANIPRLGSGTVLGQISPGGPTVRMVDLADWGAFRREHYYAARNRLPRNPAGLLRGYGQTAWVDGAGRLALPAGVKRIVVTADATIPSEARLQIDAFEREDR
jgi:hypothetical protein